MKIISDAARELRALRDRTGLSRAAVAGGVGMKPTTYQTYEDTYKKQHQPVALMEALVPVLAGKGSPPVTRSEIMALAGVVIHEEVEEASPADRPLRTKPPLNVPLSDLDPQPGDSIYDFGEAALIRFWRALERPQRIEALEKLVPFSDAADRKSA